MAGYICVECGHLRGFSVQERFHTKVESPLTSSLLACSARPEASHAFLCRRRGNLLLLIIAWYAAQLYRSLEGSELRDNCFAVVVRHERFNQLLHFRYHAAGVLAFHASAPHLGSEPTRLELKGDHDLARGSLRRR